MTTQVYLTYSRDLGDFKYDLKALREKGLQGIRLINKGKTREEFIARIEEILAFCRSQNFKLELLIDLPGEKALIGNVGKGIQVQKDETYVLCEPKENLADNEIPGLNLIGRIDRSKVLPGDTISIADGELEMEILDIDDHSATCRSMSSFFLTSNRSLNIKGNKLPVQPLSTQDRALLDQLKSSSLLQDIKILVSFITNASQVKAIKDISSDFYVLSKIENIIPETDLEAIIEASDALMLGRGDLSDSSRMHELFPFQKLIIEKSKALNKELILATGLFADLKNSKKPSISDVMDFGYLRSMDVSSFLIAGSNAHHFPFETLDLMINFEKM